MQTPNYQLQNSITVGLVRKVALDYLINLNTSIMKQIFKKNSLNFSSISLAFNALLNTKSHQIKFIRSNYSYLSIFVITIIGGCSKQNSTTTTPPNPPFTISVNEKTTNKPIAGAKVSLLKCSNYDFQFGCTAYSTFATLTTNAEGKIYFSVQPAIEQIEVEADKYWTFYSKTEKQNITLAPKTRIEVNVKKDKTYAPTDILSIGQYKNFTDLKSIGLPIDTIVYIDGYGFTENKIYWFINFWNGAIVNTGSSGGSTPNFYINGFDTARIEIKY